MPPAPAPDTAPALTAPARRLPPMLVAVALILALGGVALNLASARLRNGPAANRALVDTAATSQVIAAVGAEVTEIFSYNYADVTATRRAAAAVLAGRAAQQYEQLFGQVERGAPSQRLVLTTRVARAGVMQLSDDTARLLVFLDQKATRPGGTSVAAAQLAVTVQRTGGRWRITGLDSR